MRVALGLVVAAYLMCANPADAAGEMLSVPEMQQILSDRGVDWKADGITERDELEEALVATMGAKKAKRERTSSVSSTGTKSNKIVVKYCVG